MKLYHVLQYCIIIIPPLCHFTILGQKNMQNMPLYYTVEQGKIPTEEEWQNGHTKRTVLCFVYVLWPWLSNRQTFYWNGLLNRTDRNFGINDTLMVSLVLFMSFTCILCNWYDVRWVSKTKSQNARKWRNGIINPLFNGWTYNMSRHFPHCSYFNCSLWGSEKYYVHIIC